MCQWEGWRWGGWHTERMLIISTWCRRKTLERKTKSDRPPQVIVHECGSSPVCESWEAPAALRFCLPSLPNLGIQTFLWTRQVSRTSVSPRYYSVSDGIYWYYYFHYYILVVLISLSFSFVEEVTPVVAIVAVKRPWVTGFSLEPGKTK